MSCRCHQRTRTRLLPEIEASLTRRRPTVLEAILTEVEFPSTHFGPENELEEVEQESVGSISATDYIKWVQRSLNRLYGSNIRTDGRISSAYRSAVRKFNLDWTGRDYADVDEQTQNQLIFANEGKKDYVEWVIRRLNQVGKGPLSVTETYTTAVKKAIKAFQKSVGLKVDGFVGSKTELALIKATGVIPPGEHRPKKKTRPVKPKSKSLKPSEIKLFVWGVIGEKPEKVSGGRLAGEFVKFTGLQDLLRKPGVNQAAKTFFKTYFKTLASEFRDEPTRQFGLLVGASYSLVDAATGARTSRTLKKRTTAKGEQFREGFASGYAMMRKNLRASLGDPALKGLLERLAAGSASSALRSVYRALFEVTKPRLKTMKSRQYFAVRENCRFDYPAFKVKACSVS